MVRFKFIYSCFMVSFGADLFPIFLFNLSQFFPQERGHGLGMFVDLGQYGSQCSVANGTVPFALGELGG